MLDLMSLEGELIQAIIPAFKEVIAETYRLHKIEPYGIWVESQQYTNTFLDRVGSTGAPRTFVVFVPWSGISAIFGSVDIPSLSDTATKL